MTDPRAAAIYALVLVPTSIATLAIGGWVMDLSKQAPGMPSGVVGWTANILPALLVGLFVYLPLAHFVRPSGGSSHSLATHARRSAPLYVVAVGIGALLVHDAQSPDFWSFGQLVLWPWLAAVAGILADGFTALRRQRNDYAPGTR